MTTAARKLAFLDRDGVINHDLAYIAKPENFHLIDGVPQALKLLKDAGYALVVVTNQSGIGRRFFTEEDYRSVTEKMRAVLAEHEVTLDLVLHCPHHPDAGCCCRKPAPGMLVAAAQHFGADLGHSVLFGDKTSDIAAGRAAGVATCVRVGAPEQTDFEDADSDADDLITGVRWLLKSSFADRCRVGKSYR